MIKATSITPEALGEDAVETVCVSLLDRPSLGRVVPCVVCLSLLVFRCPLLQSRASQNAPASGKAKGGERMLYVISLAILISGGNAV